MSSSTQAPISDNTRPSEIVKQLSHERTCGYALIHFWEFVHTEKGGRQKFSGFTASILLASLPSVCNANKFRDEWYIPGQEPSLPSSVSAKSVFTGLQAILDDERVKQTVVDGIMFRFIEARPWRHKKELEGMFKSGGVQGIQEVQVSIFIPDDRGALTSADGEEKDEIRTSSGRSTKKPTMQSFAKEHP